MRPPPGRASFHNNSRRVARLNRLACSHVANAMRRPHVFAARDHFRFSASSSHCERRPFVYASADHDAVDAGATQLLFERRGPPLCCVAVAQRLDFHHI